MGPTAFLHVFDGVANSCQYWKAQTSKQHQKQEKPAREKLPLSFAVVVSARFVDVNTLLHRCSIVPLVNVRGEDRNTQKTQSKVIQKRTGSREGEIVSVPPKKAQLVILFLKKTERLIECLYPTALNFPHPASMAPKRSSIRRKNLHHGRSPVEEPVMTSCYCLLLFRKLSRSFFHSLF